MIRLRPGALIALSALSLLTLLASACGDSGDDEGTTPGGDGTASASRTSTRAGSTGEALGSSTPGGSASASASATATAASGSATPSPSGGSGGTPAATATIEIVTPVATATFVAAEGDYCDTVTATSPPSSILGLLEIDGEKLPAGTEVMVAFDGTPGPMKATREAGGYRVDFGTTKKAECANKEGAAISVVVAGVEYETGLKVGSAVAIRFDIVQ